MFEFCCCFQWLLLVKSCKAKCFNKMLNVRQKRNRVRYTKRTNNPSKRLRLRPCIAENVTQIGRTPPTSVYACVLAKRRTLHKEDEQPLQASMLASRQSGERYIRRTNNPSTCQRLPPNNAENKIQRRTTTPPTTHAYPQAIRSTTHKGGRITPPRVYACVPARRGYSSSGANFAKSLHKKPPHPFNRNAASYNCLF